jgi:hypothetical protein
MIIIGFVDSHDMVSYGFCMVLGKRCLFIRSGSRLAWVISKSGAQFLSAWLPNTCVIRRSTPIVFLCPAIMDPRFLIDLF